MDHTLRDALTYSPHELAFGTSGLRGQVVDMTQLEAYINTVGFLRYIGLERGATVYVASDFRPSSDRVVAEQGGRGQLLQAVVRAIGDEGGHAVNLGKLPTPGLTCFAMQKNCPSVMVTGSHIPFDRNGIKFNRADGEVLKSDEKGILAQVARVREEIYRIALEQSPFDAAGMLRAEQPLPAERSEGRDAYLSRYFDFFEPGRLKGRRVIVYQHSALARDLLVELLQGLGAEAVPLGRSETFVPIDTEDIQDAQLATLQAMVDGVEGPLDAIVSTDGDSDRPLVVSVSKLRRIKFHNGDLLGIVVARWLGADAVAVPISCNDAVDRVFGDRMLGRTRIGSPHVIAAMKAAAGHNRVVGFEANGGFLTGSDIERDGRLLRALPTRDAVLPILAALYAADDLARETGASFSLRAVFDRLPRRFSRAGLLDNFPIERSRSILEKFSPGATQVSIREDEEGADLQRVLEIRDQLSRFFTRDLGFGRVTALNTLDGLRIWFDNGDVAHVRPSGNAPQLRIYANADSEERAQAIVATSIAEPDGILRQLEREVAALSR